MPLFRRVAHAGELEEVALTAFLHVEDPGRHDGVHDFDCEANGAVELICYASFHGTRVGMHEGCAWVAFGEFFHHEVGEDGAVGKGGMESEVVLEIKVVGSDLSFGTGGQDTVHSTELASVRGGGQVRHEVDNEAHAGVVVDGHLLIEAFLGFFAAFESHVAGGQEECIDERFSGTQIGTHLVNAADEGDVFLYERGTAFGIQEFQF